MRGDEHYLLLLVAAIGLYFLPWLIAWFRGHRQVVPIFVVNLFLGWTLLGWVGSLAWSVSSFRQDRP